MKPEQINIAIAESMGWHHTGIEDGEAWGYPKEDSAKDDPGRINTAWIPDYHGDLNAMHDVQESLNPKQTETYEAHLWEVLSRSKQEYDWKASAAQRSEAYLRTIGKWVDDENNMKNSIASPARLE